MSEVNIPQLLAVLVTAFLIYRFFFSSSSSSSSASSSQRSRINEASVEQILNMFPQLERRTVIWDLQRNGGSVAATTERVLGGRALDSPPPSFQPPPPPSTTPQTSTSTPSTNTSSTPRQPDLITRYNLSSKVASISKPPSEGASEGAEREGEEGKGKGKKEKPVWPSSKSERQALLQRRREEMILTARRKMEEEEARARDKGKGVAGRSI
ncbi:hypothetical protein MMC09_006665 [Bachmanniomyces sp. S44760]|nr:hypothetical protein [Bachmanniomyces sp. S44760]